MFVVSVDAGPGNRLEALVPVPRAAGAADRAQEYADDPAKAVGDAADAASRAVGAAAGGARRARERGRGRRGP